MKWPKMFTDRELRMNLFTLYVYFEIGGTGGGCFRYMYSRFLKEAMRITGNEAIKGAVVMFDESGKKFSEVGLMFKDAQKMEKINEKVRIASEIFNEIADIEERAFSHLSSIV
ncbi:MAG TPA: DUF4872 domain-containing protein [Candidatus Methanoperedens sp.]